MASMNRCPSCKKSDQRKGVLVPARGNQLECAYCGQKFVEKGDELIKVENQRGEPVLARNIGTIHQLHGVGNLGKKRADLSQLEGAEEKDD
ncbi:MAG: hypothetical protein CEO12_520 [Parcubacteria group bacterium Gr01-1014_46]|nr:MAG: hypothetical protein CEO12_520 [Parcubacteria group bacterium Gr01-1014_46]